MEAEKTIYKTGHAYIVFKDSHSLLCIPERSLKFDDTPENHNSGQPVAVLGS